MRQGFLEGKVVVDFGCPSLEVRTMEKLPFKPDPRGGGSGLFLN